MVVGAGNVLVRRDHGEFKEFCKSGEIIVKSTVALAVIGIACTFFSNISNKVAVSLKIGTGTLFVVALVGLTLLDLSLKVTACRKAIR